MPQPQPDHPSGGPLQAAIANAVVRIVADYTGRGPTRARTTIAGDWIMVTLEDNLTKGERRLVELGRGEFVRETRRAFQSAMRDDLLREVAALTGREAIAFFSDNHLEPDMALEAILLQPNGAGDR